MRGVIPAVSAVCLSLLSWTVLGQQRVSPRQMYDRIMIVVPLIGSGTLQDPKRPMFVPPPKAASPALRTGILAYTFVLSDDGKFALCEFVARDHSGFKDILTAAPSVSPSRVFFKGIDSQAAVEAEFKKYKKDFDFNNFGVHIR